MTVRLLRLSGVVLMSIALGMNPSVADDGGCPISAKMRGHENTEWSISYGYHYTDKYSKLPRVLLVGDSICNGYQGGVCKILEGKVNVTYWVSSYCLTSKAYLPLLACQLDDAQFDVIHFNNGLHSLSTDPARWGEALREVLCFIRKKQPQAKIVWTSSTPLKDPARTVSVKKLNEVASKVVAELGNVGTDDLFALLDSFDRQQYWSDLCHHKAELRARESEQVAQNILQCLAK